MCKSNVSKREEAETRSRLVCAVSLHRIVAHCWLFGLK